MSNQFGFLSDDTFAEKMDTMNQFLAAIATGQGGSLKPTSWSDVQALVRKGLASKVFAVGDQLTCQRGSTTLVWDIIGFDIDTPADKQFTHSMTLQLHEVFDFVQFNAPAAMYYAEEELAAGTYHVTPKNGWSGGMGNGKTYQFTLAKAVPKGGQIVWNGAWDQDPLKYDIKTYASPTSTTVIETVKPTEGTGGTELTTLNSGQRMCYGSNNYKESAVRGWLNSDKVAGSVWTPATNYDRPPSWVSNKAGFMNGMDADFLAVIGKTTKVNESCFPKRYRWCITAKIVDAAVEISRLINMANSVYVNPESEHWKADWELRRGYQVQALAQTYSLLTMMDIAYRTFGIEGSKMDYWTGLVINVQNLLRNWKRSDENRYK